MTQVFVANNPTEAHLIAGVLSSCGIDAEIRGEALFGARGEVPPSPSTLPTVWVEDEKADEARQILAVRPDAAAAGVAERPWKCATCGETIEPQFDLCWNCGRARHPA